MYRNLKSWPLKKRTIKISFFRFHLSKFIIFSDKYTAGRPRKTSYKWGEITPEQGGWNITPVTHLFSAICKGYFTPFINGSGAHLVRIINDQLHKYTGPLRFETAAPTPLKKKVCDWWFTLPETNIALENRLSQKETSITTIHFQVRTVSFRGGTWPFGLSVLSIFIHLRGFLFDPQTEIVTSRHPILKLIIPPKKSSQEAKIFISPSEKTKNT